jgi:hypothetical protein
VPGFKACLGNQIGTCASDGMKLESVKVDCVANDQICTESGACAETTIDTLGEPNELGSVSSGTLFGNVIDVTSNRRLTQIEANMVLAGERDLRWVVMEVSNSVYVARAENTVKNNTGGGYFSSGAIDVPLRAGSQYWIGVVPDRGGAAPYYDPPPWQTTVSFGRVVGGQQQTYAAGIYAYNTNSTIYDLRFTTVVP